MRMIHVTVIMPVYNAEKYLYTSISSLLLQTSPNWELICVDDGSTDSSLRILREYESQDDRIKVLVQENAGPAVARARAIERAETEYVCILDADDAFVPDYIERMLQRAEETNADCVVPDVEFYRSDKKSLPNKFSRGGLNGDMLIEDGPKAFSMTIPWQLHGWQMIRTSLAKQYYTVKNVSYSKFNSDEYITRLLYLKSSRVALCDVCYHYNITPDSITRKPTIKKLDYLTTLDKLADLCEEEHIQTDTRVRLFNDYYITLKSLYMFIPKLSEDEHSEARSLIQNAYKNSYRRKLRFSIWMAAPIKTKIKFALSMISFNFIVKKKSWIKNLYHLCLKKYRSRKIRNRNVTIISNNCWGGFMYQSCGLQYNSPLVGLYFYAPEYIEFLKNLRYNIEQPLHFIPKSQSKYANLIAKDYIIGVLGDTGIEIVFMHYHSESEILAKWERRKSRVNYDNMIVKFSDSDSARDDKYIREFDALSFKHKVCFTGKDYPDCKSVICMKEYEKQGYAFYEWAYSYRYYDFVREANILIKP